jgi:Arc/MetJ-type ribon-helix-helix transcriptional regulator
MTTTKEITVTIPEYLYEVSLRMTALGLFRDLSELVSAGLRRELREAQQFLEIEIEPENWSSGVQKLRAQIQQKRTEIGQPPLSETEVIAQLRATRREIWEHDYKPYYTPDA